MAEDKAISGSGEANLVSQNKPTETTKNQNKTDKKAKKKEKKESKIARSVKETTSELKKVTWPTFGYVVKNTGIVLAVVAIFTLFLFGVSELFSWIIGLLY